MSRKITTAAELDALPVGSVVLDHTGDAHQKFPANTTDPERWVSILDESRSGADMVAEVAGTFTVLHDPSAPAPAPSATRDEVARTVADATYCAYCAGDCDECTRAADALLARFTITPKEDR